MDGFEAIHESMAAGPVKTSSAAIPNNSTGFASGDQALDNQTCHNMASAVGSSDALCSTDSSLLDEWVKRDSAVVWHGFTQMATYPDNSPVIADRAEGREIIDVNGKRYFDAISSLWVNTLGHRVRELDEAIIDQLARVAHTTMLGNGNTEVIKLAEALSEVVPVEQPHFLFASDGACAVEQALKIAYQYFINSGQSGRDRFLVLGNAYHGDTVGSMSLGDSGFETQIFDRLKFGTVRSPGYDDQDWLDKALSVLHSQGDQLCCTVVEPLVQGASGMWMADPEHISIFREACRDTNVLFVADEVATGFGRTGAMFASDLCGIRPDIMCIGKGLTGGYLPMSATVVSESVFREFLGEDLGSRTFYHGHSYGGNALCAAVALKHLELISKWNVLDNVRARSDQLVMLLNEYVSGHELVKGVRCRGLMAGVELNPPKEGLKWGRKVCAQAVQRGVLLRPLGDVVVLVLPLTTTEDELLRVVKALKESLDELAVHLENRLSHESVTRC